MTVLLKGGKFVNVFTGEIEEGNILMEHGVILGVGDYNQADEIHDVSGKILCPGFIDSHIHIESTMLTPVELAKICVPHGTTSIVADPHEITNVCGTDGIEYILQASQHIPMSVYVMLPSCVPATKFDESGAELSAEDLEPFYDYDQVLGLGEVMDYPGVIARNEDIMEKIHDAKLAGKIVNGHAPMVYGKDIDKYISAGIGDDHECSNPEEAKERIRKGQYVMIRHGTAAKNLHDLISLLDYPYCKRCMFATDDKHPADLVNYGHIDYIIKRAVEYGQSAITAIQIATIQTAEYYHLDRVGAIAPGFRGDILVLNDLDTVDICDVYRKGHIVAKDKQILPFTHSSVDSHIIKKVTKSVHINSIHESDLILPHRPKKCRVMKVLPYQLITEEKTAEIDWETNGGIDVSRDILKIAVIERHNGTGHIGLSFIEGMGLKEGAIASSVSHDSHNIVVIGTNDRDMVKVANHIFNIGGGLAVCKNGEITADLPLPIAGLMSPLPAAEVIKMNENIRAKAKELGDAFGIAPFMHMAFVSLPVIPHIKLTTKGLVDVDRQCLVPLEVED